MTFFYEGWTNWWEDPSISQLFLSVELSINILRRFEKWSTCDLSISKAFAPDGIR